MRFLSAHVKGYKRFERQADLWVTSPLIAIVGPNEAGKTSLLDALQHLSRNSRFARTEFTDRRQPESNDDIIWARYAVDAGDRRALGGLLDADTEYRLTLSKDPEDAQRLWWLEPLIHRDAGPRSDAIAHLRKVVEEESLVERTPGVEGEEDEVNTDLSDQAATVARNLEGADEDLNTRELAMLPELATALRERYEEAPPEPVAQLLTTLDTLHAHEEEQNPHERAGELLAKRTPPFLFFRGEHRSLQTDYEWADYAEPTAALSNLFHVAGVDYAHYREVALDRDRRDELQPLERAANKKLAEEFSAWTQVELSVEFRTDHEGLQLQVHNKKTLKNVPFDQRSSGLRYFVALVAFAIRYAKGRPPVLLIDEAEMHLHYGGQADLMQVFERQTAAQTIIYSTHSIGCLPEDLGTTIRVVEPTDAERSELRDSFWGGGAGLTPLMLAMGATALAFTPSRFAVIGEGPSEAILLPTLLREARDGKYEGRPVSFQVAPGLAEVAASGAADLELDAGNVAYVHDADEGGRTHAQKLSQRAHDEGRVFELGGGKEEGLCIEDLVERDLYADAVNRVIADTREPDERVAAEDIPDVARPDYLRTWCSERGIDELTKTFIAKEVLRIARERGTAVPSQARRALLSDLYEELRGALKVPAPPA